MYAMRPLRNFKTNQCCYLTPLAKSGYIAVAGGEKNRYLPGKQYRILRKGKAAGPRLTPPLLPHHWGRVRRAKLG